MARTPANFRELLPALFRAGVEFILIGGGAAVVHGSARVTYDIDVLYRRSVENHQRLVDALAPHAPYLRDVPAGLPFHWDVPTINSGFNFTLTTELGELDLLASVTGGGGYEDLLPYCVEIDVFGVRIQCVTLERLIQLKRAAGRPKDWEVLAELQALHEEQQSAKDD